MNNFNVLPVLSLLFIISIQMAAAATPVQITAGQLFVGGTSYGTDNHQTYLAFNLTARKRMPQTEYKFLAEQFFSVFQNHPVEPVGDYEFAVQMPYDPSGLVINGQIRRPVWYSESRWIIKSFAVTPIAKPGSPQFIEVEAPFKMTGIIAVYGAGTVYTKFIGLGTAELKFENLGGRYFLLEARYNFGSNKKELLK